MKRLKIIIALGLFFTLICGANAQKRNVDPVQKAEKQIKRLTKKLGLTTDQQKKVRTIIFDAVELKGKIGEDVSKRVRRKKSRSIKKDVVVKLKTIFTAEQLVEYDKMIALKREKRRSKRK